MISTTFDVIIVDGGTAELASAARLTEDPDIQMLVVEAGEDLSTDHRVNLPVINQLSFNTPSNWGLQTVPQKWLDGRQFNVYGGRVLGGSGALNTFLFVPTIRLMLMRGLGSEIPVGFGQASHTHWPTPWGTLGEGPLQ
ncbi:hypothetical protein F5B19DRAFT_496942 [Rostrohypoxylon terebratum]|nr:hypothetical protein F5B19DRAFT_496942 [Rostrohypoxylon terebratum]